MAAVGIPSLYLIIITVMIIVGNRYSTRIQRLTARRGLAVLATLFLLSYTKILSTVSRMLFFYTPIIHLPGESKELVWSVDTSIKLFSGRFITVFVACLVVFLIILPFNAVLLFTRTLLRIKCINNFISSQLLIHIVVHTRTAITTGLDYNL